MLGPRALCLACATWLTWLGHVVDGATASGLDTQEPFILWPPGSPMHDALEPSLADTRDLTLRHIYHHGTHKYPDLHKRIDIPRDIELMVSNDEGDKEYASKRFSVDTAPMSIHRMVDRNRSTIDGLMWHAETYGEAATLPADGWTTAQIRGPNTTDKATVISFAWMAANAYVVEPGTGDWHDVEGGWKSSDSFGWELDGLRGYIFMDDSNSTAVISLKGTSMAVFDGAETTTNDKENDNLFGSCCCGQGGQFSWVQVCDCMTSTYTCNSTCVVKSLRKKNRYYKAALDLYHNVTERYPTADIWMTGHSLGGVVSALVGLTHGVPVMTYEAYPDALAASRLGLPVPPGYTKGSYARRPEQGIYHYGHTADPVFMGSCNTALSSCSIGGYAMESLCHSGKVCRYDTVADFGWGVSVMSHRILNVIPGVLERYDAVPLCEEETDCSDCFNWKFFKSNGTEKPGKSRSSSHSSTKTRTRTETCKTPGWWGCLDEPTSSPTTTTSSSTSTCQTPGWFGCNDPTTTTTSATALHIRRTPANQTPVMLTSSKQASTVEVDTVCGSQRGLHTNEPCPT